MPKIIFPEMKFRVISLFYQAYTRDEIARETGLSQGTVSNFLVEFKNEIGLEEFEALKIHARFLKRHNVNPQDTLRGIRTSKTLEKYGITDEKFNLFLSTFIESLSSGMNLEELVNDAAKLTILQKSSGISTEKIVSNHERLSSEIPELQKQKQELHAEIKMLTAKRQKTLESNKITAERLDQFVILRDDLSRIGIPVTDLPQYKNTLNEINRFGYNPKEIISKIEAIHDLESKLSSLQKSTVVLEKEKSTKKTEYQQISQRLENLKRKYENYSDSIGIIQKYLEDGQDPSSIIIWNKILQIHSSSITEFEELIKKYHSLKNYLTDLVQDKTTLEKLKKELESKVKILKDEQKILSELNEVTDVIVTKKLDKAKEQIMKLEGTNPLRIIYQQKDDNPYRTIQSLRLFFDELKKWCQKNLQKRVYVTRKIERMISELEREMVRLTQQ